MFLCQLLFEFMNQSQDASCDVLNTQTGVTVGKICCSLLNIEKVNGLETETAKKKKHFVTRLDAFFFCALAV